MVNDRDVESLLAGIPKPRVAPGAREAALKRELLQSMREPACKPRTAPARWAIAACVGALLMAASGWGAQQLYLRYFLVEERIEDVRVMPDGSIQHTSAVTVMSTDDPTMTQEAANQTWRELRETIDAGEYLLLDIQEDATGELLYIYALPTADGGFAKFGTPNPLP
jgi:hypothetical protein